MRGRTSIFLIFLWGIFFALNPVGIRGILYAAAQDPQAVVLNAQDHKILAEIAEYLNKTDSLTARFVQISDEGRYSEGKVWVQRPGRMRFEYEPPTQILIVANDGDMMYHDAELNQTSYIGIDETPLSFILKSEISFADPSITITGFNRQPGIIQVELVQTETPEQGALIISFNDLPIELRKWEIIDSEGVHVNVALFNVKVGDSLEKSLFNMVDPSLDIGKN